jgi:hypothetical protein
MDTGQLFNFIVSMDIEERMERVIMINDGRVVSKTRQDEDVIYTVERT